MEALVPQKTKLILSQNFARVCIIMLVTVTCFLIGKEIYKSKTSKENKNSPSQFSLGTISDKFGNIASIFNACEIQPTLINLHPNRYNQELHYYLFAVKLDKCPGSFNTLNDFRIIMCSK